MAMKTDKEEINIGILDIYGFEIFEVLLPKCVVHLFNDFFRLWVTPGCLYFAEKWFRTVLY